MLGAGDYSYVLGAGDYSYTLGAGDYSNTLGAGDYSYTLGAGDYSNIPLLVFSCTVPASSPGQPAAETRSPRSGSPETDQFKPFTGRKEMFYLTTHSTHFIYGYMASDIW